MRELMFGWEFPPYISGGLGTACFGLTKGLAELGSDVIFVIPRIKGERQESHVKLVSASEVPLGGIRGAGDFPLKALDVRTIDTVLRPYLNEKQYRDLLEKTGGATAGSPAGLCDFAGDYGPNLVQEIIRYGQVAEVIARTERFDVIHAHDWMTVFAGVRARQASGKPYIYHVHAVEFDRSGENVNQEIYDIERYGMESADHIIAVSHYTKRMISERYGIHPDKISVVYNAVSDPAAGAFRREKGPGEKIVLFLGRITFQKGPDYFIEAAARVLEKVPDTTFVMAGSGDMMPRMIERVAALGIGKRFHFTGFLRGADVERIYAMSDLYVMPSVSEPFGISPLEAARYDVPVIISRQSGVSEVLHHVLKVDFWDVNELADKMIAVLKYPVLAREMKARCREEMKGICWRKAAEKTLSVYRKVCHLS